MKTWLKRTLVGLFGATVLVGGLAACSQRHRHGDGWQAISEQDAAKMKERLLDRAASKLDLDEAQKARLGIVADKMREQRDALVAGGNPRDELRSLIAGASFDRAKAKALVDAKTGAITAKSPELIAAFGDFYDSLKPEQQAKVREYLERRRHGWRG